MGPHLYPESVKALLEAADIKGSEAIDEPGWHALASPEAWWSAVLGTGYRGTLDKLDEQGRERVRAANLAFIRDTKAGAVEANVVYASARKMRLP